MVAPIDYMSMMQQPDIGQSIMQGLQIGGAYRQQQQEQQALVQAKALKEQYAADLGAMFKNPTAQAAAQMVAKYPGQREAFAESWKMLSEDQKNTEFSAGTQAFNAIQSGNVDVAKKMMDERIAATKNSGRDTSKLTQMRTALDSDPKMVQGQLGLILSSTDPERWDKMTKTMQGTQKAGQEAQAFPLEQQKRQADIRNIDSQIVNRAAVLGLDQDKLASEMGIKLSELKAKGVEMGESGRKLMNDSVASSITGEASANAMETLATKFTQEGGGSGTMSGFGEWFKKSTGNQNAMTELRNNYAKIRNSAAMKLLPPGPASDKDVQMAREGMPPETADVAHISSFLRGTAKIERMNAQLDDAKSQWVGSVGSLGRPRTDINIGGVTIPAGTTFPEFQRQFAESRAKGLAIGAATAPGGAVQSLFQKYSK